MNVTLIGASGFVGTRLIDLFKETPENYCCKNIDLLPSHFFNDITTIGDVRNPEQMEQGLENADIVILLAAQHRDDVTPVSLYYDTNVGGMEVTLKAMEKNGVKRIIFFSSVAVYGLDKKNPDENHPADPFNHYGKSKWQAEQVLQEWHKSHSDWNINIIRPTVIFGERNRGNVYNLLKQISSGKFLMVGKGENKKSMAYVGNVVAFVKYLIDNVRAGYNVFNYIDKPDNNMNQLVGHVSKVLDKHIPSTHFPFWLGMMGGYGFDLLAKLTGKKLAISSVRVKKFCATTEFDATKVHSCGFIPPFTLDEGLARTLEFEFVHPRTDDIQFVSE
ncbi:MAG: NAD-dependent epimerase/dehydratase family protein [Muribaculaceae bacterium]|nr:NAD-dependent epimerase/dehydratase family protein [Muribaculaceae bacterium]